MFPQTFSNNTFNCLEFCRCFKICIIRSFRINFTFISFFHFSKEARVHVTPAGGWLLSMSYSSKAVSTTPDCLYYFYAECGFSPHMRYSNLYMQGLPSVDPTSINDITAQVATAFPNLTCLNCSGIQACIFCVYIFRHRHIFHRPYAYQFNVHIFLHSNSVSNILTALSIPQ